MKRILYAVAVLCVAALPAAAGSDQQTQQMPEKMSEKTRGCISCHRRYTPGIVADWLASRHARTTVADALKQEPLARRVSTGTAPDGMADVVVGCYECHSLNGGKHADNFNHFGNTKINVIVTPADCASCHPEEREQYGRSKKAHAYGNLMANPVYHRLADIITGVKDYKDGKLVTAEPTLTTRMETCLGCHGTKIEVRGIKDVEPAGFQITAKVPDIVGWPNQGVGRINPDGSMGSCTTCHARHSFSIKMARDPHTCAQCHLEPDVPAYEVYEEGKHGNIWATFKTDWNFTNVPWVPGRDFRAPVCATCHNSLMTTADGEVIARRTHDFGSRLWVRLFGLPYSHPQPKHGDTTVIKSKDGLPLPTALTGEPATDGTLIDVAEQARRQKDMKGICSMCHSTAWVNGHFAKMDATVKETDAMTLTSTKMLLDAWGKGIADNGGLKDPALLFDEAIEQQWAEHWLFYSNAIRYSSAMTGAPDMAAFKLGWWRYLRNLSDMQDRMKFHKK